MEIKVIRPEECPERFFRITSGDKTVYCRGNDAVSLPCEDGRFTVATAEKRDYLNFRIKNRILRALHIGVTAVLSVPFRIIAMFTDAYSGSYALGEFTAYSDCDPFVTEREFEVQNTGETVTLRYIPPVLRKPTAVFLPPDIKGDIPCTGGKTVFRAESLRSHWLKNSLPAVILSLAILLAAAVFSAFFGIRLISLHGLNGDTALRSGLAFAVSALLAIVIVLGIRAALKSFARSKEIAGINRNVQNSPMAQ